MSATRWWNILWMGVLVATAACGEVQETAPSVITTMVDRGTEVTTSAAPGATAVTTTAATTTTTTLRTVTTTSGPATSTTVGEEVIRTVAFDVLVADHPVAGNHPPDATRDLADGICTNFEAGRTLEQVVWALLSAVPDDWDDETSGWFLGMAVAAFCPEHEDLLSPAPTHPPTTTTPAVVNRESPGMGSRDDPVPIGEAVGIGDWEISVLDVTPDAAEIVASENPFNDPPAPGHRYVLVTIQAEYTGDSSASLLFSLSMSMVGNSAVAISDRCLEVIPDELDVFAEVFGGGVLTGNLCWEIPESDVEGLVLIVDESLVFDGSRAFLEVT